MMWSDMDKKKKSIAKKKEVYTECINKFILQSTFANTSVSPLKPDTCDVLKKSQDEVSPDVRMRPKLFFLMPEVDLLKFRWVTKYEASSFGKSCSFSQILIGPSLFLGGIVTSLLFVKRAISLISPSVRIYTPSSSECNTAHTHTHTHANTRFQSNLLPLEPSAWATGFIGFPPFFFFFFFYHLRRNDQAERRGSVVEIRPTSQKGQSWMRSFVQF